MAVGFWKLPENLEVAIHAPEEILQLLSYRIVISRFQSDYIGRIVKLDWAEADYKKYYDRYWQHHFTSEEIVWKENDSGWLFLGYGFFLTYSSRTDSALFFAIPDRLADVFTFSYPFLNLLIYLLKQRRYISLHAAVIGIQDRFVLIPGKQNTGKSTTAASWLLNGGQFVTDDFCFVQQENPRVAHGFYPTLRLREQALALVSNRLISSQLEQRGDSKYFFSLLTHRPDQFVAKVLLQSIFCLTIQSGRLSNTHVGPRTGFEYLLSSIAFSTQYRADSRLCLQVIKQLVREIPILQISLSPNIDENYSYLKELITSY
ncbi:hypothetical protein [Spirosoma sp. KNUC1025]|uniref:hypothetical protein n=1 Tax=Spirosoma sp. KNUC1025 TaxID=2894082 RepID=UPI00386BE98A|nr:hypothetical protein LN737_17890 [Spirosoma sp. KNUC1025]